MYPSTIFCCRCVLLLMLSNPARALGIEYGVYTQNARSFNEDCVVTCDVGRHLVQESSTIMSYDNLTSILTEMRNAGLLYDADLLQQSTEMTWSAPTCRDCVLPTQSNSIEPLPVGAYRFRTGSCDVECVSPWAKRGVDCVNCTESICAFGQYLTGHDCLTCAPCVTRFADLSANVTMWTSFGMLDVNNSCAEQCVGGYFETVRAQDDQIQSVCEPYTVPSCTDTQYQVNGTTIHDAYCEDCITACDDMNMTATCSAYSQAVCVPCEGVLQPNELWTNSDCTRQCALNYVLNEASNVCELCDFTCPVGTRTPAHRSYCEDCEPCDTIPNNATFYEGCRWECDDQFQLNATSNNCEHIPSSLVPEILSVKTGRCELGQRLTFKYLCVNCADENDVVTPPLNQQGLTWQWRPSRSTCEWDCLPGFYHYSINSNMHQCLVWSEFLTNINGGITETKPLEQITLSGRRRQIRSPAMTEWQLVSISVVVVVTVLYLCV